jgi:hypothetical protein
MRPQDLAQGLNYRIGAEGMPAYGRRVGGGVAPILYGFTVVDDAIEVDASEAATAYWLIDTTLVRTGAQVFAGGGEASGSFAVGSGLNDEALDISAVTPGDYYFHLVLKGDTGLYSAVLTQAIIVEAPPSAAVIQSLAYSDQSFNAACDLVMPATITAGSTLVAILTTCATRTITAPAGWNFVPDAYLHEGGTTGSTYVYKKTADGTEGGTTVSWTANSSVKTAFALYEFDVTEGEVAVLGVQTYDPPSLTPPAGLREYILIAHASHYATGYATFSAPPSGYGGLISARTNAASSGSTGDRTTGSAHRVATVTSEDPGMFTYSGTPDPALRAALTIAVW